MRNIPSSAAMDAAATGAGPGTVALPTLYGGDPEQIERYAHRLLELTARLTRLLHELRVVRERVWPSRDPHGCAWSGETADAARRHLDVSLDRLDTVLRLIRDGARTVRDAAKALDTAQDVYRGTVRAANPVVASLLSSFFGSGAASALSRAQTAVIVVELVKLGRQLTNLGESVGRLGEDLAGIEPDTPGPGRGGSDAYAPSYPSVSPPTTGPVAPTQPWTDPFGPPPSSQPVTGTPANAWVPVNPGTPAGQPPAGPPRGGGPTSSGGPGMVTVREGAMEVTFTPEAGITYDVQIGDIDGDGDAEVSVTTH